MVTSNSTQPILPPQLWPAVPILGPGPRQPGSLFEQTAAVAVFLTDPRRNENRDESWELARARTMPHVRREARL